MKAAFRIALLIGGACWSDRAFSATETELVTYATIFSMSQEAEKNCPNTYASDAAILILKEENHVTEKDDRALKLELNKAKTALDRQISADGAPKWCKSILELYGPKGRVKNVLITR